MNQSPGNKLSSRERTELEKYVKFLVFKMSQVIVQSRFGEKRKVRTSTKSSVHDWFNLAIEDNIEIQAKAKEAYSNILPLKDFCICTEILLKTADGDTLVLETWSLRMNTSDFFCDSPYVSYTSLASVYCRMTLLLKSVIAVTRVTPAYRLSSRQSADTYVILFRIYSGEPQVHQLGEHYQGSKIGEVLTPVGTLRMSVSYRSKDDMTITPQKVEKGSPFMVKSDYFKPDMSPKKYRIGKNHLEGPYVFDKGLTFNNSNSQISSCHCGKHLFPRKSTPDSERGLQNIGLVNGDSKKCCLNCQSSPNEFRKVGAFAPSNNLPDTGLFPELAILEKPFLNLSRSKLHHSENKQKNDDSNRNSDKNANLNLVDNKNGSEVDYNCNANEKGGQKLTCSDFSDCEDFVMVELKPPFADCDGDNDLGAFFRECQSAPPLASFALQPTLEEQVTDITSQLVKFETSMNDFDNFVDSICHIDTEK
ncbi:autophagy-related protein 13-like isoform X1 [Stegodyphus dumicola]|uniref:autophagy-related protein 13-like isoform X1 n=1 Tax=Stegodyphus dumicola TaxID=202533 RepID=UPI0015AA458F|nr:autophagy-related protein 13-like isoform X1 [Stegodyphus dumicola]